MVFQAVVLAVAMLPTWFKAVAGSAATFTLVPAVQPFWPLIAPVDRDSKFSTKDQAALAAVALVRRAAMDKRC